MNTSKQTLVKLHDMLFPFGKFTGDYGKLCHKLDREIKTLCLDHQYGAVIMIGKFLGLEFDRKWTALEMCKRVRETVTNLCLSRDDLSASYLLYEKTRVPTTLPVPKNNNVYVLIAQVDINQPDAEAVVLGVFTTKEGALRAFLNEGLGEEEDPEFDQALENLAARGEAEYVDNKYYLYFEPIVD